MTEDSIPVLTKILAIPTPPENRATDVPTVPSTSGSTQGKTPTELTPKAPEAASKYSPAQFFSRLGSLGNLGNFGGLHHSTTQPPLQPPAHQDISTDTTAQPVVQHSALAQIPTTTLPSESRADIPILIHAVTPEPIPSAIPISPVASMSASAPTPVAPPTLNTLDVGAIEAAYQNACAQITAQLTQELCAHLEQHFGQVFQQVLPPLLADLQEQVRHNLNHEMTAKIHAIAAQSLSHQIQPPANQ